MRVIGRKKQQGLKFGDRAPAVQTASLFEATSPSPTIRIADDADII